MTFLEKIQQANELLKEIRAEIDTGVTLSAQEAGALEEMTNIARDMRDMAIAFDPAGGVEVSRRWNISQARVSQIRKQVRSGISTYRERQRKERAKKAAKNTAKKPVCISSVWR